MKWFSTLAAFTLMGLILCTPVYADTSVVVTGVEGDLKTNVELIAGTPPNGDNVRKLRRYVAELPALAKSAMSALGYYGADVEVKQKTDGDNTCLLYTSPSPRDRG